MPIFFLSNPIYKRWAVFMIYNLALGLTRARLFPEGYLFDPRGSRDYRFKLQTVQRQKVFRPVFLFSKALSLSRPKTEVHLAQRTGTKSFESFGQPRQNILPFFFIKTCLWVRGNLHNLEPLPWGKLDNFSPNWFIESKLSGYEKGFRQLLKKRKKRLRVIMYLPHIIETSGPYTCHE